MSEKNDLSTSTLTSREHNSWKPEAISSFREPVALGYWRLVKEAGKRVKQENMPPDMDHTVQSMLSLRELYLHDDHFAKFGVCRDIVTNCEVDIILVAM